MTAMAAQREKARSEPRPADPIEGMRRMADAATASGDALHKFVDAAQPLYASLTDEQKHRLPLLMHGTRGRAQSMAERMRRWWDGGPRREGFNGPRDERRDGRPDRDNRRPAAAAPDGEKL